MPESFENWHRVYVLITAGPIKGHGASYLKPLPMILILSHGEIVRVHQHGAAKKQQNEQAIGKSRGGLSTKIHAAVDALGNPVRLMLTDGQTSEYTQAEALIEGFEAGYVLADKGYDSDWFVSAIEKTCSTGDSL